MKNKRIVYIIIVVIFIVFGLIILSVYQNKHDRSNIVLILIDTLRADHLGCYGYHRDTTPAIDNFADKGILFTQAYSVSPWTRPAVASIFTGLYPQSVLPPMPIPAAFRQVLPQEPKMIAEILANSNYFTSALVDNTLIDHKHGFSQGFHNFIGGSSDLDKNLNKHINATSENKVLLSKFKEQMQEFKQSKKKNFFSYVHIMSPHWPYKPPPPYNTMFGKGFYGVKESEKEGMINLYDGDIRSSDSLVKGILEHLESQELLENTFVIITSDHGEGFWEHGDWEHGENFYNETLHIPLIIRYPGSVAPKRINQLVVNMDIFPTIMHIAKIKDHPISDGVCLLHYSEADNNQDNGRYVFMESCHTKCINQVTVRNNEYKFIYSPRRKKIIEVYNEIHDKLELNNLINSADMFSVRKEKRMILDHIKSNEKKRKQFIHEKKDYDEATLQQLKSLGYLQ